MISKRRDPTNVKDGSKLHVIRAIDKRIQPPSNLHHYYLLGLGVDGRILAVLGIWQYSVTLKLDPDSTCVFAGRNSGCIKGTAGTEPRAPSPTRAARTPRNKESPRSISVETWNSDSADGDPYTHESFSTFDARSSSGSDTSDSTIAMGPRPNLLQDLSMLPDCDSSERTWVWVNYGTAGVWADHSEDITSWLLLKYRPHRNRAKHEEEIACVIDSFNAVFLSEPTTMGAQNYTQGYGGQYQGDSRAGSGARNRAGGSQREGVTSGNGERQPKRHKPSNDGGPNQGGGPPQGNASRGGNVSSSGRTGDICTLCDEGFATTDDLLQHQINRHCCPICEEKLRKDENGRWVLPPHITSVDKAVPLFRDPADMKQHVTRIHLRPYECPVETCKERFGGSSFKRHLREQHRDRYSEQDVEREFRSLGSSNLGYPELTTLVDLFRNACPAKEKLKEMLYRNGVKLYDCENRMRIVDNLQTHSNIPFEPPSRSRKPRKPRNPKRGADGQPRPTSVSPPGPIPAVQTMSSGGTTAVSHLTMPSTGVRHTGFDPGHSIHNVLQPSQQVQQTYQNQLFGSPPQQQVDMCPPAAMPTVWQYTSAPPQVQQHHMRPISQNLRPVPPDAVDAGTVTSAIESAHAPPPPPPPVVPTVGTFSSGRPLTTPIPTPLPTDPPVPAYSPMSSNYEQGHHLWDHFDFDSYLNGTSEVTDGAPSSDSPAREQPAASSDPASAGAYQALVGDEGENEYEDEEERNLTLLDRRILVDLEEFRALLAVISTGVAKSGSGALVAKMLYTWDSQNLIQAILEHGTTAHTLFTAWPPKAVSEFGISDDELQTLHFTIAMKLRAFKKMWESMSAKAVGRHGSTLAKLLCADEYCPLILAIHKYAQQAMNSLLTRPPQESSTPADSGVCDGKTTVVGTQFTDC